MIAQKLPIVLIADAERSNIEKLRVILGERRYHLISATSGRGVMRLIREQEVDVAIIDTKLTDIQGHKLVPIIKDMNPGIRVIVTTGEHSDGMEEEVRRVGVVFYAIKPHEYPMIKDAVRTAVLSRQREKLMGWF